MPRATMRPGTATGAAGVLAAAAYAALVGWGASVFAYDLWIALVVLPPILLLNLPLVVKAGKKDPDPRFLRLLVTVFVLKQLSAVARYLMAFVLYDGVSDAAGYHGNGVRLAESYRAGYFDADIGRDLVGTGFVRVLTGILYTITGPSIYVAYSVFSLLGFWGLYFLYRAFRVSIPDGDARRYSLLVLLLPSMLFWPSGLGKEAWMTFAIGLMAYGGALLLSGHRQWLPPLVLGGAAGAMVRPHIIAALAIGLATAYLLGRSPRRPTELTPVIRGLGALAVLAGTLVVVNAAGSYLGVQGTDASSVDGAIEDTADRTAGGGSQFQPAKVHSVFDVPMATVTVLARPFVTEADNSQMLVAALEGSLIMVLGALALPRLRSLPGRLRQQPYLIACLAYSAVFIYAFSNFSNFGLLTRERVQVLPFVLVLFALPKPTKARPRPFVESRARQEVLT